MHDDRKRWRRWKTAGSGATAMVIAAGLLLAKLPVHAADAPAASKSQPQHPATTAASSPAAKPKVSPYTIASRRQAEEAGAAAQQGDGPRATMRPAVVGSHVHSASGRSQ